MFFLNKYNHDTTFTISNYSLLHVHHIGAQSQYKTSNMSKKVHVVLREIQGFVYQYLWPMEYILYTKRKLINSSLQYYKIYWQVLKSGNFVDSFLTSKIV